MKTDAASLAAGPAALFGADHRECDGRWADVEAAREKGDARMGHAWTVFDRAMRRHFDLEDRVLFPAFEAATGITRGPTAVMRLEHQQMRGVLDQMGKAADDGRWDDLLDAGDTLLMLIQQHNAKEEGMLYPMCEAHLRERWPAIAAQLAAG